MYFELRNKEFYIKSFYTMIPIVLQQLITTGVNFGDNLMVGNFAGGRGTAAFVREAIEVYTCGK